MFQIRSRMLLIGVLATSIMLFAPSVTGQGEEHFTDPVGDSTFCNDSSRVVEEPRADFVKANISPKIDGTLTVFNWLNEFIPDSNVDYFQLTGYFSSNGEIHTSMTFIASGGDWGAGRVNETDNTLVLSEAYNAGPSFVDGYVAFEITPHKISDDEPDFPPVDSYEVFIAYEREGQGYCDWGGPFEFQMDYDRTLLDDRRDYIIIDSFVDLTRLDLEDPYDRDEVTEPWIIMMAKSQESSDDSLLDSFAIGGLALIRGSDEDAADIDRAIEAGITPALSCALRPSLETGDEVTESVLKELSGDIAGVFGPVPSKGFCTMTVEDSTELAFEVDAIPYVSLKQLEGTYLVDLDEGSLDPTDSLGGDFFPVELEVDLPELEDILIIPDTPLPEGYGLIEISFIPDNRDESTSTAERMHGEGTLNADGSFNTSGTAATATIDDFATDCAGSFALLESGRLFIDLTCSFGVDGGLPGGEPVTVNLSGTQINCTVSSNSTVNLRAEPNTSSDIKGTLAAGETLTADGQQVVGQDIWLHLTNGSWVHSGVVIETGDCINLLAREP